MKAAARHYLETLDEAAKAPAEKLAIYRERLADTRDSGCFDRTTTQPVVPAPNPDKLPHGSKDMTSRRRPAASTTGPRRQPTNLEQLA